MVWVILGFVSVVLFMVYQLLALRYDCYHCLLDDAKKCETNRCFASGAGHVVTSSDTHQVLDKAKRCETKAVKASEIT